MTYTGSRGWDRRGDCCQACDHRAGAEHVGAEGQEGHHSPGGSERSAGQSAMLRIV